MSRLPEQPGERIDRSKVLRFTFDGKPVDAYEGDTIGSALYANGQRTFSRSFKYHRRRGLMCCAGQCPNCLVEVDGAPGIRACTEPVKQGMSVNHLNARPALDFDLMRITDLVGGPFTPPGFYYKTFIRPRRFWPLYEKVLRHAAGLGVLPRKAAGPHRSWRTEYRRRHVDVLVVGGGEAGLHAAIAAAESGADVLLADEGAVFGGRMLTDGRHEAAADLVDRARVVGVELLEHAPVLGVFDGLAAIWQGSTLHQVRAPEHVFATGAIEQPLVFPGNDLPGVMLAGGARRLLRFYGVKPGERAVVVGEGDVADALRAAGIQVVAAAQQPAELRATGRKRVTQVALDGATYDVDLLVIQGPMVPASSLVRQASTHAGTHLAGDVCGEEAAASGRRAGLAASARDRAATAEPAAIDVPAPIQAKGKGKCVVCFCDDVTAKDLELTVNEGYDSLELAKRYSTATMGPCQGRMCHANTARAIGLATGASLDAVGQTTARPPWSTVPMGALAGRPFEPAKRSALHERHRALGANVRWAGDWRRAYDYGDPEGEALAVGEGAGIIDVSTLGKLLVTGPDAGELLDRLYPNVMSSLKPGRIRYGVLTNDAGRITDDGTVARLDEDSFYVTTTSAGAASTEQWFTWWLAVWDLDARVTDLTQGVAAVNLAGPRARQILEDLTSIDVSKDAFPYLNAQHVEVADVSSLVLRIGFVGEVGYEIHCPAPQAVHVWDAICAAGARPFGLEPQRLLRLQKQHVIVGQDTDSESTPYGAAMPWAVNLDKPQDFIGRWALAHGGEHPTQTRLVGFRSDTLPAEGAVVLGTDGTPAGQVTSARRSPRLEAIIGMAWVPAALAVDGGRIEISDNGNVLTGTVTTSPFYDPEGAVVRS